MDLVSIGSAAVSGAFAGGLAALIFEKSKFKNKTAVTTIVSVFLFFAFNTLSEKFILPELFPHKVEKDVQAALNQIPIYASIKRYEPEFYNELINELVGAVKKGTKQQEIIDLLRPRVAILITKRMKNASDEAVLSYAEVMMEELSSLEAMKNDLCFKFLYPQVSGGINPVNVLPPDLMKKDQAALDMVIKTSTTERNLPPQEEVIAILQPLIGSLQKKYGDDVAMLNNPAGKNVNRIKLCSISKDFYIQMLELPKGQSAKTLRWLLSQI